MRAFLLNIVLALAWSALTGAFTVVNLVTGFLLGYLALWVMQDTMATSSYFSKVRQIVSLTFVFLWALILANIRVSYSVLAPFSKMRPGIVAIPLDIESDEEITLLANMITLTPGTLTIDVSDDKRVLYVHGMHVQDPESFREEIKQGFEKRVQEAFE
jgi:multicomponent Na+:H+ antiporter subunit E